MTPATQLVDTQLHQPLLEAMPARLSNSIRLIGGQPRSDFVPGNGTQQDIGIVGRLSGNEHRTNQLQRSRCEPMMPLSQVDLELLDPTAASDDGGLPDPALNLLVIDETQRIALHVQVIGDTGS